MSQLNNPTEKQIISDYSEDQTKIAVRKIKVEMKHHVYTDHWCPPEPWSLSPKWPHCLTLMLMVTVGSLYSKYELYRYITELPSCLKTQWSLTQDSSILVHSLVAVSQLSALWVSSNWWSEPEPELGLERGPGCQRLLLPHSRRQGPVQLYTLCTYCVHSANWI